MIKTKVIIGETTLSKTLTEILYRGLTINKWCKEQEIKRQKIKL